MIVDADAYYAGIFASRFEAAGWKVRVVETVEDAELLLERKPVDAVMIDVEPFETAIPFIHALHRESESVVTVLTNLGDRKTIEESKEAGVDGYFLKGHFFPSEAIQKLKRLIEERVTN